MPSYNIGDIVIVREDLEDGEYYGEVYVTEEMADLAGCAVTITDVFQDGQRIKVRETDRYDYVWKPEMFSGLAPDYLYHKGDVVAIRDDLDEYETYRMLSGIRTGECQGVTTEMQRMAGQAVTISGMYSGQYKIVCIRISKACDMRIVPAGSTSTVSMAVLKEITSALMRSKASSQANMMASTSWSP